jgi:hypothetical protein
VATPTHTDTTEENLPQRKLDRGNRMLNKKRDGTNLQIM